MGAHSKVGADSKLTPITTYKADRDYLAEYKITFQLEAENLVDNVWTDQPPVPKNKVMKLDVKFTGKTAQEKSAVIATKLHSIGATALVVTTLDDIAWLLNLRGSDIAYNPVFFAYLLFISHKNGGVWRLYIDSDKTVDVTEHLELDGVTVHPYQQITADLEGLHALNGHVIAYDGNACNYMLYEAMENRDRVSSPALVARIKAVKNPVETAGMKFCQYRDGAAVVRYLAWLEKELEKGENPELTEYTGAEVLEKFRSVG